MKIAEAAKKSISFGIGLAVGALIFFHGSLTPAATFSILISIASMIISIAAFFNSL